MRAVSQTLRVLVRGVNNDIDYPGTEQVINFNDAACPSIAGDEPQFKVLSGFVVRDFDESASDAFPAPAGWQWFEEGAAAQFIPDWSQAGLEFHAATRIVCSNNPANFWIVSQPHFDVRRTFELCCSSGIGGSTAFIFAVNAAEGAGFIFSIRVSATEEVIYTSTSPSGAGNLTPGVEVIARITNEFGAGGTSMAITQNGNAVASDSGNFAEPTNLNFTPQAGKVYNIAAVVAGGLQLND